MMNAKLQSYRTVAMHSLGDAVLALWLLFAQRGFLGSTNPAAFTLVTFAFGVALLAFAVRIRAFTAGLLVKVGLLAPAIALLAYALHTPPLAALWLGGATALAIGAFRTVWFGARALWPTAPLEPVRWVFLGGVATAVMKPFYGAGLVGGEAARASVLMLGDFVTQLRAAIFPVWVGQSEYAFDGAVAPLRFAPLFPYAGGCLDLLTARALNFAALQNATLALAALATATSAYLGLRLMLPSRPVLACGLAALFVTSPSVLGLLMTADHILTFVALPFLPVVLYACWRVWADDTVRARCVLAAGLAGLWLGDPSIAGWTTILVVAGIAGKMLARRTWSEDARRGFATIGLFGVLGAFPIFSGLGLVNPNHEPTPGLAVAEQVDRAFPANMRPLDIQSGSAPFLPAQTGYAALGAFAVAMLLLRSAQPRGAAFFVLATCSVALVALPVPGFNEAFWTASPNWFVAFRTTAALPSLIAIWTALMLFTLAVVATAETLPGRNWRSRLLVAALLVGGLWSWREAAKLTAHVQTTVTNRTDTRLWLLADNGTRPRLGATPLAATAGHTDPYLGNRLLDGTTLAVLTTNADAAAPRLLSEPAPGVFPRLLQAGTLMAVETSPTEFKLEPALTLAAGRRHALRLESLRPEHKGLLRVSAGSWRRDYPLPDSTAGSSPGVWPLPVPDELTASVRLAFVDDNLRGWHRFLAPRFAFARYALYAYTADDLAVKIDSLVPYRAHVEVAGAAWLETPRLWLAGYRATVNGHPAEVRRSPANLAMIALPAGGGRVGLDYIAPWWLSGVFWMGMLGWLAVVVTGVRRAIAAARALPA